MTPADGPAVTPADRRRDDAAAGRGRSEAVRPLEVATGDGTDATSAAAAASPAAAGPSPVVRGSAHAGSALVFDDPLYGPSPDDSDRGWGESYSAADDDFIRFLNEKPPHHI